MADQLIGSILDRLTHEQCAEMQHIVDQNGQPFESVMAAIRAASPEVLEALTLTMVLPDLLRGNGISEELVGVIPAGFWD